MTPERGECEALKIVAELADVMPYDVGAVGYLRLRAKKLRLTLAKPPEATEMGRVCTVPDHTLRQIAQMHACGMRASAIARRTGVSRFVVRHHLRPSRAMINACLLGGPEAQEGAG